MEKPTVHLFIFDSFADWEPAQAIAGINNPAFQAEPGRYRVRTVGVNIEPVTSMGGVTVLPDITLSELEPGHSAMLILPGGGGWDDEQHPEAIEKTRQFLAAGVPIAAICGATAGLALAGILDERKHTSNAREYLAATSYQGAALYQDQPAVTDGNVITASAMTALDFAYHIFKKLDLYEEKKLEAWYGLYKTGDPAYFFQLQG